MTKKNPAVLAALALFALEGGCASRYDIVLRDHNTFTVIGEPKYDKALEVYHFKDAKGQSHAIAALRVDKIEPHKKVRAPLAPTPEMRTPP